LGVLLVKAWPLEFVADNLLDDFVEEASVEDLVLGA